MVDSQKIKNHSEHQAKLMKRADSDSADAIKDLVDYLMLYKGSAYSDIILKKGIALVSKHPDFIIVENMYLIEEFFMAACELKELEWA